MGLWCENCVVGWCGKRVKNVFLVFLEKIDFHCYLVLRLNVILVCFGFMVVCGVMVGNSFYARI